MRFSLNPMRPAKQFYKAAYGEPWPRGWRVVWVPFISPLARDKIAESSGDDISGLCDWRHKVITLSFAQGLIDSHTDALVRGAWWPVFFNTKPALHSFGGVLDTLLHEFVHMRHRLHHHPPRFYKLLAESKLRLFENNS